MKSSNFGLVFFLFLHLNGSAFSFLRVCYYTNWSQYRKDIGKFLPEDLDPYLCTHIVFAFATLKNNKLAAHDEHDESKGGKKGLYKRVNDLKRQNPKLKTLLAVGGWKLGSEPFSTLSASRTARQAFVNHAVRFLRKHGFDGLEIDWEYPADRGGAAYDKQTYLTLITELHDAFNAESRVKKQPRLTLTAAVPANKGITDKGYNVPELAKFFDFVSLMSYDFHGPWEKTTGHNSPLYSEGKDVAATYNMNWAARYWLSKGMPSQKLVIGVPMYGRSYTLASTSNTALGAPVNEAGEKGKYTGEAGLLSTYEICENLKSGWQRVWDKDNSVPYAFNSNQWVSYEDATSVKLKAQYIKENRFAGVMVWALDLDDFSGAACGRGKYPLVTTIKEVLDDGSLNNIAQPSTFTVANNGNIFQRTQNNYRQIEPPSLQNNLQVAQGPLTQPSLFNNNNNNNNNNQLRILPPGQTLPGGLTGQTLEAMRKTQINRSPISKPGPPWNGFPGYAQNPSRPDPFRSRVGSRPGFKQAGMAFPVALGQDCEDGGCASSGNDVFHNQNGGIVLRAITLLQMFLMAFKSNML